MINNKDINDKVFLDENGEEWITYSPAGTGEYSWWCRNADTDIKEEFPTKYVIERIANYDKDVKRFENKEKLESKMFNLIKKISNDILRKEILKEELWSDEDITILNQLKQGKYNINCE